MADSDGEKGYLGYLDKEMSIMGVLSAFSVTVLSLYLFKVAGAEDKDGALADVWRHAPWCALAASLLQLFAALLFYRQRSLLAWHYGQIALARAQNAVVGELLDEADSWATWILYRWGFTALTLGLAGYGLTFVMGHLSVDDERWWLVGYGAATLLAGAVMWRIDWILRHHPYDEDPLARSCFGLGSPRTG
jgi:hypothetical protein